MKRASLSVEWLEHAMIERNWTQEYVAEQIDVEVKTVQRWKRGTNQPHPRQYYRLCKLFQRELPSGFQMETTPDEGEETQIVTREGRQASLVVSPSEVEDACTRFLATDLTVRLQNIIWSWSFRNVNARYHELQVLLIRELEQKDNTMQESPINRRNALRRIAALPVKMYSLSLAVPVLLHAPGEFLPQCAAGITACWYLRKGKDLAFISDTISRYIPTLKDIVTNGKGTQCKDAADLLAQCMLLKATCVSHTHADHMVSLNYAKQAETYSGLAGNTVLSLVAVRKQAAAYDYADDWEQAMYMAERAKHIIEQAEEGTVPLFAQSYIYAGLANYAAHSGKEQEALTSIRQAEETFLASNDEAAPPIWIDFNKGSLLLHSGLAYYHLDKQTDAISLFAKVGSVAQTAETQRTESYTDQVMAEVNRDKSRDMEFCIENWQKGLQGSIAMRSQQAFTEAKTAYAVMRAVWPGEQRIKKLSEQIKHW